MNKLEITLDRINGDISYFNGRKIYGETKAGVIKIYLCNEWYFEEYYPYLNCFKVFKFDSDGTKTTIKFIDKEQKVKLFLPDDIISDYIIETKWNYTFKFRDIILQADVNQRL